MSASKKGVDVPSTVRRYKATKITSYFQVELSSADQLHKRSGLQRESSSSMNSSREPKGQKMINIFCQGTSSDSKHAVKSKGKHASKNPYKRSPLAASCQVRDPVCLKQVCNSEGLKSITLASGREVKDFTSKKGDVERFSTLLDSGKETSKLRSPTSGAVPNLPTPRGSKSMSARNQLYFSPSKDEQKASTSMERPPMKYQCSVKPQNVNKGSGAISGITLLKSSIQPHEASLVAKTSKSSVSPFKAKLFIPSDLPRSSIDAVRKNRPTDNGESTKSCGGGKIVPYNGALPIRKKESKKPAPLRLLSPGKRMPVISECFQKSSSSSPVLKDEVTPPCSPVLAPSTPLLGKKSPVTSSDPLLTGMRSRVPSSGPSLSPQLPEKKSSSSSLSSGSSIVSGPPSPLRTGKKSLVISDDPLSSPRPMKKKLIVPPSSPKLAGKKSSSSCPSSPLSAGESQLSIASPSKKLPLHQPSPLLNRRISKDGCLSSPLIHRKRSSGEHPDESFSPSPNKKLCKDGCLSSPQQLGVKPPNKSSPLQLKPPHKASPMSPPFSPWTPSKLSPIDDPPLSSGMKLLRDCSSTLLLGEDPSSPSLPLQSKKFPKDAPPSSPPPNRTFDKPSLGKKLSPGKKSPDKVQKSPKKGHSSSLDKGRPSSPLTSQCKGQPSSPWTSSPLMSQSKAGQPSSPLPPEKVIPSEPSTPKSNVPTALSVCSPVKRSLLSLNKSPQARGRTITYTRSPVLQIEKLSPPMLKQQLKTSPISSASESSDNSVVESEVKKSSEQVRRKITMTDTQHRRRIDITGDSKTELLLQKKIKVERCEEEIAINHMDSNLTSNISEPCLGQFAGEAVLPRKRKGSEECRSKKKRRVNRDLSIEVIAVDSPMKVAESTSKRHSFVSLLDIDETSSRHPLSKKVSVVDLTLSSSVIDLTTLSDSASSDNDNVVDLVRSGRRKFDSPSTPPLRDPDLTPELVTRRSVPSSTPNSHKSAGSAPRKSVSVRKTLFQFPSPGEREITPPLEKDLITPMLPMFQEKDPTLIPGDAAISGEGARSTASSGEEETVIGGVMLGAVAIEEETVIGGAIPGAVASSGEGETVIGGAIPGAVANSGVEEAVIGGAIPGAVASSGEGETVGGSVVRVLLDKEYEAGGGVMEVGDVVVGEEPMLSPVDVGVKKSAGTSLPLRLETKYSAEYAPNLMPQQSSPLQFDRSRPWKATPIKEVSVMMGMRGISCAQVSGEGVRLLSSTHESVVINKLDLQGRLSSYLLCSVIEHLQLVTTPSRMPKGSILSGLWEMLLKAQEPNHLLCLQTGASDLCRVYLGQLLSIHPPGQHPLVDQQYSQFIGALCEKEINYGLWHHLKALLRSRSYLGTFLVDLLVADFWAVLTCLRSGPPLFMSVFWPQSSSGGHMTSPIRELVQEVARLVLAWNRSMEEGAQLRNLMDLLFLVGTVCTDLTTELLLTCNKFPRKTLLCFASYVHSATLYRMLVRSLPHLKETHDFYASLFNPDTGTFSKAVKKVALVPTAPILEPKLIMKKKCLVKRSVTIVGRPPGSTNPCCSGGKGLDLPPRSTSVGGEVKGHDMPSRSSSLGSEGKGHEVLPSSTPCPVGGGKGHEVPSSSDLGDGGGKGHEMPSSGGGKGHSSKKQLWPSNQTGKNTGKPGRPRAVSIDYTAPNHVKYQSMAFRNKQRRESLPSESRNHPVKEGWAHQVARHAKPGSHCAKHDPHSSGKRNKLATAQGKIERELQDMLHHQSPPKPRPPQQKTRKENPGHSLHLAQHARTSKGLPNFHTALLLPKTPSCPVAQHPTAHCQTKPSAQHCLPRKTHCPPPKIKPSVRHSTTHCPPPKTKPATHCPPPKTKPATHCPPPKTSLQHPTQLRTIPSPPKIRCESTCATSLHIPPRPHPRHHQHSHS